ncbi:cysteine proteinase [Microstroma glucosiphilum]|uniref:Cysteine proteinase n=1 Tax=Pseudomicrostroma glucosiphilum TaxID=1684307 RepID=A0A316U0F5_9BASI|nr:cysteine proteinase [Pseudomicrostroma glucosiphilum]PWN18896.1 cysteine proteinase [Pseudomicrostroma glucosiphilum]
MTSRTPPDMTLHHPSLRKSIPTSTSTLWSRVLAPFRNRNRDHAAKRHSLALGDPSGTNAVMIDRDSFAIDLQPPARPTTPLSSAIRSRSVPNTPKRIGHEPDAPTPGPRKHLLPPHLPDVSHVGERDFWLAGPALLPARKLSDCDRARNTTSARSSTSISACSAHRMGTAPLPSSPRFLPLVVPNEPVAATLSQSPGPRSRKSDSRPVSSRRSRTGRKPLQPRRSANDLRCAQSPSGLFNLDALLGLRTTRHARVDDTAIAVPPRPSSFTPGPRPSTAPAPTSYDAWDDYLYLVSDADLDIRSPIPLPPSTSRPPPTTAPTFLSLSPHVRSRLHSRRPHPLRTSSSPALPDPCLPSSLAPQQQRKEAVAAAERARIEEELKANGGKVDEAALERQGLTDACESLNVDMYEITPDGHCLYSAIADQLNLLGRGAAAGGGGGGAAHENYKTTRAMTARWMRGHEDDFKPFISDNDERMAGVASPGGADVVKGGDPYQAYCDAVERTAVWGGQPEILAMSRAYRTPIWVVQAGSPIVKVGQDEFPLEGRPLMISYHRKMYGLGEHYNSLRGRGKGAAGGGMGVGVGALLG